MKLTREDRARLRARCDDMDDRLYGSEGDDLLDDLDELERAFATALQLDQSWSVAQTLRRLADAAEHLLRVHDCDALGWEEVSGGVERARAYADKIDAIYAIYVLRVPSTQETP